MYDAWSKMGLLGLITLVISSPFPDYIVCETVGFVIITRYAGVSKQLKQAGGGIRIVL